MELGFGCLVMSSDVLTNNLFGLKYFATEIALKVLRLLIEGFKMVLQEFCSSLKIIN